MSTCGIVLVGCDAADPASDSLRPGGCGGPPVTCG
jgi:hypothetical protein